MRTRRGVVGVVVFEGCAGAQRGEFVIVGTWMGSSWRLPAVSAAGVAWGELLAWSSGSESLESRVSSIESVGKSITVMSPWVVRGSETVSE